MPKSTRVVCRTCGAQLGAVLNDRLLVDGQRVEYAPRDGLTIVCIHLRRGGPRPAFFQLPLRRVDCGRCADTIRRSLPDEADRCDVCGQRGVAIFHPFAMRMGPALVLGDGCPDCAGVLGIRREASA